MPLSHQSLGASLDKTAIDTGEAREEAASGEAHATLAAARDSRLRDIERQIERFPSLPSVVTEVERVANDPSASVADFEDAVRVDPVVTAKVLRLANSAFYARARAVTTVGDAVGALGVRTLRSLVLAAATGGVMDHRLSAYGYSRDGFWKHSFATALCSRAAARRVAPVERLHEEVFVAGLLHDIGKIVLDPLLAETPSGARGAADHDGAAPRVATPALEMERLGWDHAKVGELIASKWNLPPEIGEAIVHHHDPEAARAFPLHVSLLVLANDVVKESGIGLVEGAGREAGRGGTPNERDARATRGATPALHPAIATRIREELASEIANVRALCEQFASL